MKQAISGAVLGIFIIFTCIYFVTAKPIIPVVGKTDAEVMQPATLELSMHEIDKHQYIVTDNVTGCQTILIWTAAGITSFPRNYPSGAQVCGNVWEGMAEWNDDGLQEDPNYEDQPETDIEKGFPKSVPSENQIQ